MKKEKKKITNKQEGIISVSSKGTGYVAINGFKEDIEIDFRHLKTALNGDTVEIILHPKSQNRQTGEVSKIIKRAKIHNHTIFWICICILGNNLRGQHTRHIAFIRIV